MDECNNTTCSDYDKSCPWNCAIGSGCLHTARAVREMARRGKTPADETEVERLQRELDQANSDLEQLRRNCFSYSEVEKALRQVLSKLMDEKREE